MHVVIFTGGVLRDGSNVRKVIANANYIIAADSGAARAFSFAVLPSLVIGDFDSLDAKTTTLLKKKNCKFVVSTPQKDETDTELAIQYALKYHATKITILGGIEGNRLDHIFANISLALNIDIPTFFVNGETTAWAEKGPKEVTISGKINDLLSLIPLTAKVIGIKTTNLQYPLLHETLSFGKSRGISNVFLKKTVSVNFKKGFLFFVHIGDRI